MSQPEKTFRIGAVSASVFVNTTDVSGVGQRTFRTVTLQRRYRDGEDWKYTSSLNFADLPAAVEVLRMALDHIVPFEGEHST